VLAPIGIIGNLILQVLAPIGSIGNLILQVLAPIGIIGGIASYITNNMGPLLNVYLMALSLDKFSLVGESKL
jgi:hypothetical protein